MKKAISILTLGFLLGVSAFSDPQISRVVTLTTGSPVRVTNNDVQASSLFIQALHGGSNIVYVLFADPNIACNVNTAGQLVAELAPATATAPGGSFTFPSNGATQNAAGGSNMHHWCVQGTSSDQVVISYNLRN